MPTTCPSQPRVLFLPGVAERCMLQMPTLKLLWLKHPVVECLWPSMRQRLVRICLAEFLDRDYRISKVHSKTNLVGLPNTEIKSPPGDRTHRRGQVWNGLFCSSSYEWKEGGSEENPSQEELTWSRL